MNAVGIYVSKGKSLFAVMQPLGVVAASPFEVAHTESELSERAKFLKRLPGETKVVMEYTGSYYEPIARFLHNEGIYVSVVNVILIHNYSGNSVRRAKTDKKDSVRIAQYALDRWLDLREYIPVEETRSTLTLLNRQYSAICKHKTQLINNLISLIDQSFPNVNEFFDSPPRQSDGHMKWSDFALTSSSNFHIATAFPVFHVRHSRINTVAGARNRITTTLRIKPMKSTIIAVPALQRCLTANASEP